MASGELVPIVEVALVPSDPRDLDRIQAELDRMANAERSSSLAERMNCS